MEVIRFAIAVPIGIIALFLVDIGWQRGVRFKFHDYEGNQKEKSRDNFFSTFTIITALSSTIPIFTPIASWNFAIPITLLMIFVGTPLMMAGASLSSLSANSKARELFRNNKIYMQNIKETSTLKGYEFTSFAFVTGWSVYYLVYVILMWAIGKKIMSDTVPIWIVITGLVLGVIAAGLLTIGIYRKFKNI